MKGSADRSPIQMRRSFESIVQRGVRVMRNRVTLRFPVDVKVGRDHGSSPQQPRRAASMVAMSIFFITIIASIVVSP